MLYAPRCTILNFYFEKKRGFPIGIMSTCSGIGNMVFPYMYSCLNDTFSLPGTLLISGAIYFHDCAATLTLRQPSLLIKMENNRLKHRKTKLSTLLSITTAIKRIFKFDLFRHVKYAIYVTSVCLQMGNSVSNKVILPGQIRTLGLDKETIALSVSLIGASEIIGRVMIGLIADSNIISRMHIFMICSTICAVPAFCMPYLPYRNVLLAYSMVIGGFS